MANNINSVEENLYNFDNETLDDFVKINDNKIIFIYTGSFMNSISNKVRL